MNDSFAFGKRNYQILLGGLVLLILGYILMSGGGSEDPAVFSEEIFSDRRITVAPIVVLLGYAVVFYAIMYKPKHSDTPAAPTKK
ncbi:MAG: DUF3098 domain-containing protein [Flavobacteriales bacterium]|jgi:hypothetical protein